MKYKRTMHRSRSGKKLYALRDPRGRFVNIEVYKRAHGIDLRKQHTKNDR